MPALDAVLSDAREAGATGTVLGGDYALFGAWPAETVDRLRELDADVWIRGNGELPFDEDPRASYALAHEDGRIEHRRVAYDHEAYAAALEERFDGDWTATVARRIREARF
jgi:diadenosine tetraphosphatase ApaH/serine/threonine PP2A family protein phosphatase